jgi:hypothetical protein
MTERYMKVGRCKTANGNDIKVWYDLKEGRLLTVENKKITRRYNVEFLDAEDLSFLIQRMREYITRRSTNSPSSQQFYSKLKDTINKAANGEVQVHVDRAGGQILVTKNNEIRDVYNLPLSNEDRHRLEKILTRRRTDFPGLEELGIRELVHTKVEDPCGRLNLEEALEGIEHIGEYNTSEGTCVRVKYDTQENELLVLEDSEIIDKYPVSLNDSEMLQLTELIQHQIPDNPSTIEVCHTIENILERIFPENTNPEPESPNW